MSLTKETVLAAIAGVEDPTFKSPLVELGLVAVTNIEGNNVSLSVRLAAPGDSIKEQIERALRASLETLAVASLNVEWELAVPTRETTGEDPLPGVRNVLLVMSGKGGVGKSTSAANIALALKRQGARVGLLDADIYGPSVPTMFGVDGGVSSADGVHIEPNERYGIKLMSIGFLLDDPKKAIIWRGPMLHSALKQFLKDVNWGGLDYLVLDLPPGTGDVALTLAQNVKTTGAIIITTPQEVALQDVYKSVSLCQELKVPVLGVVENMSYFIDSAGVRHELFGAGGGQKIAEFSGSTLIGQVPLEPPVREWGDKGMPVVQAAPDSAAAKAFTQIAETIAARIALDAFKRSGGGKAPPTAGPTRLKIVR